MRVADCLGVNQVYVYNALAHGKRPRNRRIARLLGYAERPSWRAVLCDELLEERLPEEL